MKLSQEMAADAADNSKNETTTNRELCTTTIAIQGMTCGACTSAIESQVNDSVPGLLKFSISLIAERANAVHDVNVLSAADLVEMIEDCGFDAQVVSSEQASGKTTTSDVHLTLKIYGMTCSSCTGKVERALSKLIGIREANVSLVLQQADLEEY